MRPSKWFFLWLAVFALAACRPEASPPPTGTFPAPTASPTSTHTGLPPTATGTPEESPTPTPLPPTPTIAPPQVLSDSLRDVTIEWVDPFDANLGWNFGIGKIQDGVLVINGKNWQWVNLVSHKFLDGQGLLVRLKYTADAKFELMLDSGDFGDENYRRFSIIFEQDVLSNSWQGSENRGYTKISADTPATAESWHTILLAVGSNGEMLAMLWDESDSSKRIEYPLNNGAAWAGKTWMFSISAAAGMLTLDDLYGIQFSGFK